MFNFKQLHNKTDWNPLPLKISGTVKVSKNSPLQALARFEDILNVFWVAQEMDRSGVLGGANHLIMVNGPLP